MNIDREKAREAFARYTAAYDRSDEKVRLKIEHTGRVSDLCEGIARSLAMPEEDAALAWLLGLLHDIGRFEQLRQYGTFQDSVSVDHAAFGADLLFRQGQIRAYVESPEEDALLELAIRLHNVYRLPEHLTDREKRFADLLRDADKIDILRVNAEFPLEEIYNVTTQQLRQAEVSPDVMEHFLAGRTSPRTGKRTVVDSIVNQIAFAYELVYPISLQWMAEQGYLQHFLAFESDNPVTREQFRVLRGCMEDYLRRRLPGGNGQAETKETEKQNG